MTNAMRFTICLIVGLLSSFPLVFSPVNPKRTNHTKLDAFTQIRVPAELVNSILPEAIGKLSATYLAWETFFQILK